jgi:DNA-binding transcriptional LysR family regulator
MSVQKGLVVGGLGLTILPSIAIVDDVARGVLSAAPLLDENLLRRIVLALPNSRRIPVAVRCVVDLLASQMSDAIKRGKWATARWLADDLARLESHAVVQRE